MNRKQWIPAPLWTLMLTAMLLSLLQFSVSAAGLQRTRPQQTFACTTVTQLPQSECNALVMLFDNTNGPDWTANTNWLVTNTPCTWMGITCSGGHVTRVNLPENRLQGVLPPALENLTNLEKLYLNNNALTGTLPSQIGNLGHLLELGLSYNQLQGPLPPQLGDLGNLQRLYLQVNQLSGPLPTTLGNLTKLEKLYLSFNQLTGAIPPQLGNLSLLQDLYLANNQLSGVIPAALGNLSALQIMTLAVNQLNGAIPAELGQLANLREFTLRDNQLTGPLPPTIGNLINLTEIHLGSNQLSGSLPSTLGALTKLEKLYADSNQLSGVLPVELGQLHQLQELGLSYNQLTGTIPATIGALVNLQRLYLQSNRLNGALPGELGDLSKLEKLYLSFNQIAGPIPTQLGKLAQLQDLYLAHNQLSNELPAELGNLTNVITMTLGANLLTGPLPATLTRLQKLQSLGFRETYLCEPRDAAFQSWLAQIANVTSSKLSCTPMEGDAYESDNECTQANQLPADGLVQLHNFHTVGDVDWVKFDAVAGARYLIKVDSPVDSTADVTAGVYLGCTGVLGGYPDQNFAPSVHIEFTALQTGPLFLKLANFAPQAAGADAHYELAVRQFAHTNTPGALILVAGMLFANDPLQPNIYHVTDTVYQLFRAQGYPPERIYYLAPDPNHAHVNAPATIANLQTALTVWAADKVGAGRPLTLYLMDHGAKELIYLDKEQQQWVTPAQINDWLGQLEATHPDLPVNVIVEACYAGSFISTPDSVSKPGRIVLTSTDDQNVAFASSRGAYFSDHLVDALGRKATLYSSFQQAQDSAAVATQQVQRAWLDGDGDGFPNEPVDFSLAAQRGFAISGTLGLEWPPYIAQAVGPANVENGQGLLQATVRDDVRVHAVWAVIYPPDYVAPTDREALVRVEDENLTTIVLRDTDNNGVYSVVFPGFNQPGAYRVVIYAEDDQGLQASPAVIDVILPRLFLPLIVRG